MSEKDLQLEYQGRPINEVIIEMFIIQKQILQSEQETRKELTEIKELLNRKLDKLEFNGYELRNENDHREMFKRIEKVEKFNWKLATVLAVITSIAIFIDKIINYLK